MKPLRSLIPVATLGLLLALGCEKKLSEEAQVAAETAKTADARVAALEKELADLKAAKEGDADAKALTQEHQKAIQRQLEEAKKRAAEKKKEAQSLAAQPAPKEKVTIVEVPQGTKVEVKLATDLATDKVQAGDAWEGSLAVPVEVAGKAVWPAGTPVKGVVTQSVPTGRLSSGNGGLGIRVTAIGKTDVDTEVYLVVGDKKGTRNAKYIGGGAALGALIGILSDKKNQGDHALGGAALGAAAGTALAAGTADTVVRIPAEKPVTFTLSAPEKVTLKS